MPKLVVALILLVLLSGAIAFLVYRYLHKPFPTLVGWKAYITTVAGDTSPLELSDPFGVAVGDDGSIYMTGAGGFVVKLQLSPATASRDTRMDQHALRNSTVQSVWRSIRAATFTLPTATTIGYE